MIEANEDITLIADRQLRDVEQGQAQAKAIAEGREVHPAELLAQQQAATTQMPEAPAAEVHATVQRPPAPPPDPATAMRHLRLSIVAVVVLVLFLVWLRQRRS